MMSPAQIPDLVGIAIADQTLRRKPDIFHESAWAMGTRLDVVLLNLSPSHALEIWEKVVNHVHLLEQQLSRFVPHSDVSQINLRAARGPFPVDAFMWGVLKTCRQYHESTGGAFDIALGPLQDFGRQPVENRREEDLTHARAGSGMNNVILDEARQTIQFAHPLARIDLGGFGKGFALEQLQPILADASVRNALISFGESSILALGHHPHGDCWKLGIRDIHTGQSIHVFEVNDGAISTSGLKHFNRDGHTSFEGHIVEAGTGRLIERPLTVAVKSASPLEAEVLSTALIAATEKAGSILQNFPGCEAVGIEYDSDKRARVKYYEA